jgi:hypothetical protein
MMLRPDIRTRTKKITKGEFKKTTGGTEKGKGGVRRLRRLIILKNENDSQGKEDSMMEMGDDEVLMDL